MKLLVPFVCLFVALVSASAMTMKTPTSELAGPSCEQEDALCLHSPDGRTEVSFSISAGQPRYSKSSQHINTKIKAMRYNSAKSLSELAL